MMEKRLCLILGLEDSCESFRKIDLPYDQRPPEVGILAAEGQEGRSASLVIVAYEGGGVFSIRSQKGSKITIRGGKPREPFILD